MPAMTPRFKIILFHPHSKIHFEHYFHPIFHFRSSSISTHSIWQLSFPSSNSSSGIHQHLSNNLDGPLNCSPDCQEVVDWMQIFLYFSKLQVVVDCFRFWCCFHWKFRVWFVFECTQRLTEAEETSDTRWPRTETRFWLIFRWVSSRLDRTRLCAPSDSDL